MLCSNLARGLPSARRSASRHSGIGVLKHIRSGYTEEAAPGMWKCRHSQKDSESGTSAAAGKCKCVTPSDLRALANGDMEIVRISVSQSKNRVFSMPNAASFE